MEEHQGIYLHTPMKSDALGSLAKCFVYITSECLETSGISKYFLLGLKYLAQKRFGFNSMSSGNQPGSHCIGLF